MIVASSSSSLCLPANLARGRLTRLIYVAQHFLQIIVNRPRIRAPDEGEVRVVDVKSVILPWSMAHEPHSLMMNDRCKCGTFQSVFFPYGRTRAFAETPWWLPGYASCVPVRVREPRSIVPSSPISLQRAGRMGFS